MINDELKLEELSREQLLDLADANGKKLGFLLATSALDDEVKDAIVSILDQATPEQLDVFSRILEEGYLRARNRDLEEFLKSELEAVRAEFGEAKSNLEKETLARLENFSKGLQ